MGSGHNDRNHLKLRIEMRHDSNDRTHLKLMEG